LGSNILRRSLFSVTLSQCSSEISFTRYRRHRDSVPFTAPFLQLCNWRSDSGFCLISSCVLTIRVLLTFNILSTLMSPSERFRSRKLQVFPAAADRPGTSSFSSYS
jgi:hypothetical protein